MYKGKAECNILKKIRYQIATENGIDYEISQCDFQGDCKGTCPKCESELKYQTWTSQNQNSTQITLIKQMTTDHCIAYNN